MTSDTEIFHKRFDWWKKCVGISLGMLTLATAVLGFSKTFFQHDFEIGRLKETGVKQEQRIDDMGSKLNLIERIDERVGRMQKDIDEIKRKLNRP